MAIFVEGVQVQGGVGLVNQRDVGRMGVRVWDKEKVGVELGLDGFEVGCGD